MRGYGYAFRHQYKTARRFKTPIEHIAFQFGKVNAISSEPPECFVKCRRHRTQLKNQRRDSRCGHIGGIVGLACHHQHARSITHRIFQVLLQNFQPVKSPPPAMRQSPPCSHLLPRQYPLPPRRCRHRRCGLIAIRVIFGGIGRGLGRGF